jgi:TolB-like protein/Tfp pilus assembly protein PilF
LNDLQSRLQAALGDAYRLEKELGGGGMSRVFLAEEVRLGRKVVVKVLPPEMSAGVSIERFEREIQLAARLQHPHIVPLLSAGAQGDLLYYVMPFIEGESLRAKLVREGELPVREVVQILKEVLDALQYAHSHRVVHRDIKPDNVLISGRHVVVTDFGVAKAVSEASGESSLTSLGVALGTPAYMAPEQAAADPHVDHRADLYAVGALAYEMLTGQPPFTGLTAQAVLAKHITQAPAAITSHRSSVPAALNEIILRCLEKKAADRWQRADELLPHLDALLTPTGGMTPTSTQPISAVIAEPPRSPGWRKPLVFVGAVAVLAVAGFLVLRPALGGSGGGSSGDRRPMLVVLPIQNLGPSEDQYFADGLTDEVTNRLGGVSGLGVISRSSAVKYAGPNRDIRTVGRELGVQYVLETTLRTDQGSGGGGAKQARVSAELIKVDDDTHVWSDRYTVALTPGQVFEVQAKIAEAVAGAMNVVLLEREKQALGAKGTENAEAYEAYLKGSGQVLRLAGSTEAQLRDAERQLTRAVALDPSFALGHAQLARLHLALFFFGYDPADARLPLADAAIRRALALQPDLPEAHLAKGYYHYWGFRDYAPALVEFERARAARPSDADAISSIAYIQRRQGKLAEALVNLREAERLDPQAAIYAYVIGFTHGDLREFAEAETGLERALRVDPGFVNARYQLAWVLLSAGDTGRARRALLEVPEDNPSRARALTELLVSMRQYREALSRVDQMPVIERSQGVYRPRALARGEVYAFLGDRARARVNFDSAVAILESDLRKAITADEPPIRLALAAAYAGLGRREDALREGRRATGLVPIALDQVAGSDFRIPFARVQATVGDLEGAVAGLDSLLKLPTGLTTTQLRMEPYWDPLRNHPGFRRLVGQQ